MARRQFFLLLPCNEMLVKLQDIAYLILSIFFCITFLVMTAGVWSIKNEVSGSRTAFHELSDGFRAQSQSIMNFVVPI